MITEYDLTDNWRHIGDIATQIVRNTLIIIDLEIAMWEAVNDARS